MERGAKPKTRSFRSFGSLKNKMKENRFKNGKRLNLKKKIYNPEVLY